MRFKSHVLFAVFAALSLICPLSFSLLALGDTKTVFPVFLLPFLPALAVGTGFHFVISKRQYSASWSIVPSVVGGIPLALVSCLAFVLASKGEKLQGGGAGVALYFPLAAAAIAAVVFAIAVLCCLFWHISTPPKAKTTR
jgi:hypothetical protein